MRTVPKKMHTPAYLSASVFQPDSSSDSLRGWMYIVGEMWSLPAGSVVVGVVENCLSGTEARKELALPGYIAEPVINQYASAIGPVT